MKKIKGYTEEQLIDEIESVAKRLAPKFTFGIYEVEDIKQEAFILGMQSLDKYKGQAPLGAYLYTTVRCRLRDFKRDNSIRYNVSCSFCPTYDPNCDNCIKRKENEQSKQNLLSPIDISRVKDEGERNLQTVDIVDEISEKELFKLIDIELPKDMREDYLKLREGMYVPKKRRIEIQLKILDITDELDD